MFKKKFKETNINYNLKSLRSKYNHKLSYIENFNKIFKNYKNIQRKRNKFFIINSFNNEINKKLPKIIIKKEKKYKIKFNNFSKKNNYKIAKSNEKYLKNSYLKKNKEKDILNYKKYKKNNDLDKKNLLSNFIKMQYIYR